MCNFGNNVVHYMKSPSGNMSSIWGQNSRFYSIFVNIFSKEILRFLCLLILFVSFWFSPLLVSMKVFPKVGILKNNHRLISEVPVHF